MDHGCELKEDDEGEITYGYGEQIRASPRRVTKEGRGRDNEASSTSQHFIFKPQIMPLTPKSPCIEQMALSYEELVLKTSR